MFETTKQVAVLTENCKWIVVPIADNGLANMKSL